VALLSFLCIPASFAQQTIPQDVADGITAQEDVSVVEQRIKEEADDLFARLFQKPVPEGIEQEEEKELVFEEEVRFFVERIEVEGNTLIPDEILLPLIKPFEGEERTMEDMNKLTQAITSQYRKEGYITSLAYIPAQRLERGIFKIEVIEGKVGELIFEGNKHFKSHRLLRYVTLKTGEQLHYDELRKSIAKLNKHPDRVVRGVIRKGKTTQTSDIIFRVKEKFPFHFSGTMDNQGTESTGEKRFGFTARHTNVLGFDDVLNVGTIFGHDFGSVFTQYAFPIPEWDTTLIAGFSHAQVAPKQDLKPFGVNGISQTWYMRVQKTLHEGKRVSADFTAGFEIKNSTTNILSQPFRKDELRVLRFGPKFILRDKWGATSIDNVFSVGFDFLEADVFFSSPVTQRNLESSGQ